MCILLDARLTFALTTRNIFTKQYASRAWSKLSVGQAISKMQGIAKSSKPYMYKLLIQIQVLLGAPDSLNLQ